MKKITFLLVALCATLFANAADYTLTMSDYAATSFTSQDGVFTVATAQNTGASAPAYNTTALDLRVYANGSITITSTEAMTNISFVISTKGEFRLASLTSNVGSVAVTGTPNFSAVWSGDAKSVTITVGAQADYGTDGNAKAGQLCFTAINITTNGEGGGTVDPEPTADFEMAEAEFVYYAEYSTPVGYIFMVNLYSDMTWEENAETGGYVPTSEGNYFSLDVYTASASSFVGTYTFDVNDTYMAGTFGNEYSAWVNVSAEGVETALTLTAGTITITSNGAGLGYTVAYSLTDQNATVHTGTYSLGADVVGIYDQDGNDYSASISDGTAICNVEASLEVYTRNGNIVVPAEAGQRIEVYNMMGQTLYSGMAQNAETTISGLATQQVLVVRAGNKTAKVVL